MCLDRHWMSDFSIFSWHLLTKLKNISCFFTYHCFFDKYSFLLFWIISKIVLVFWGAIFSFNLEKGHAKWSKWTPLTWIVQEGFKTSFWQRGKHLLHSFFKFMRYMRFTKAIFEKKIGLVFQIGHVILNYKHFYHVTYILTTVFFITTDSIQKFIQYAKIFIHGTPCYFFMIIFFR